MWMHVYVEDLRDGDERKFTAAKAELEPRGMDWNAQGEIKTQENSADHEEGSEDGPNY
jgi:hypothetical protein